MLRRLASSYRSQRRPLAVIAILGVLSAGTEACALIAIAPLVQAAAEGSTEYEGSLGAFSMTLSLGQLAGIAAVMLLIALVVQLAAAFVTARVIATHQHQSRLRALDAFQDASWSVQTQEREGWLLTLMTENVNRSAQGLRDMAAWIKGAIGMGVFLAGALVVNVAAVAVIVVLLGGLALALRPLNLWAKRLSAEQSRYNVATSEEVAVLTSTARELAVFGVARAAAGRFRQLAHEQQSVRRRTDIVSSITGPIFRTAGLLLIVALIAVTADRRDVEIATIGLVAVLLYRSFSYGETLVSVHQRLVQLVPVLDQLDDGLRKLQSGRRHPGRAALGPLERIDVRGLSFRYPAAAADALQDVTFSVSVGEVLGVVGASGAGKSTLAEIVLGLRRPAVGSVQINGIELGELSEPARSAAVSLVSQAVPLIPGTVRDNVRFFRDLDPAVVEQAIASAGLSEVMSRLPEGADTMIGPGARAMSGGQAQRIGLARALAGGPALIVLDEPTSALDAGAELLVTDLIGELRGQIAVIVIAHRLTTLRHCDRVLVLDHGRKVDEGPLEDVRQRNDFLRHAFRVGMLTPG